MSRQVKPNKRHRTEFLHIRTLKGMSPQEHADFCYADMRRYFKVLLWDKYRVCVGCDKPFNDFSEASLDHIVPKSKGGYTRLANLQLMHRVCNAKKTNKMPKQYSTKSFRPTRSSLGAMQKEGLL